MYLYPGVTDSLSLFCYSSDGMIRYYEYENDELFLLSEFKSIDPQRGMILTAALHGPLIL